MGRATEAMMTTTLYGMNVLNDICSAWVDENGVRRMVAFDVTSVVNKYRNTTFRELVLLIAQQSTGCAKQGTFALNGDCDVLIK